MILKQPVALDLSEGVEVSPEKYILLGTLGAPHGVRGWVKVRSFAEEPEAIFGYVPWHLADVSSGLNKPVRPRQTLSKGSLVRTLKPLDWRQQGAKWIVKLEGIEAPEVAKSFSGMGVYVPESALPRLSPGDYYWKDLEGLVVFNLNGKNLGKVAYLIETGSNDVLVVRPTKQSIDNSERLIPYIPETVVQAVQLRKGVNKPCQIESEHEVGEKEGFIEVDWDEAF